MEFNCGWMDSSAREQDTHSIEHATDQVARHVVEKWQSLAVRVQYAGASIESLHFFHCWELTELFFLLSHHCTVYVQSGRFFHFLLTKRERDSERTVAQSALQLLA